MNMPYPHLELLAMEKYEPEYRKRSPFTVVVRSDLEMEIIRRKIEAKKKRQNG